MLVDTSVWIHWLQGVETPATIELDGLLDEAEARVAPVIVQELLQGARNETELHRLRAEFMGQPMYVPTAETHATAGTLYARCRWRGITIRSPHDCLVAALAVEHDALLLQEDRDFDRLATVEPALRLWRPVR